MIVGFLWSGRLGSSEWPSWMKPAHLCDYTLGEWMRRRDVPVEEPAPHGPPRHRPRPRPYGRGDV